MTDREKLIEIYPKIDFVYSTLKSMTNGKDVEDIELEDLDYRFLDYFELVFSEISDISNELETIIDSIGIYVDDIFFEWNELDTIYTLYDKIKSEHNPDDIEQFIKAVKPYHDERYNIYKDTIGYYGSDDRSHTENAIEWIEYYYNYIKGYDRREWNDKRK